MSNAEHQAPCNDDQATTDLQPLIDFHIGQLVKKLIDEHGMTQAEFGRRMNTTRQNVVTLLRRDSWDIKSVVRADCILHGRLLPLLPVVQAIIERSSSPGAPLYLNVPEQSRNSIVTMAQTWPSQLSLLNTNMEIMVDLQRRLHQLMEREEIPVQHH